jgi:hypothetical protein
MPADHELPAARVGRPVEVAQVVARRIGAVIVEFEAGARPAAQAHALALAPAARVGDQAGTLGRRGDRGFIPGGHGDAWSGLAPGLQSAQPRRQRSERICLAR